MGRETDERIRGHRSYLIRIFCRHDGNWVGPGQDPTKIVITLSQLWRMHLTQPEFEVVRDWVESGRSVAIYDGNPVQCVPLRPGADPLLWFREDDSAYRLLGICRSCS